MLKMFMREETGAVSIEAAIVTAVFVALAIIFKDQLVEMWAAISGKNDEIIEKLNE